MVSQSFSRHKQILLSSLMTATVLVLASACSSGGGGGSAPIPPPIATGPQGFPQGEPGQIPGQMPGPSVDRREGSRGGGSGRDGRDGRGDGSSRDHGLRNTEPVPRVVTYDPHGLAATQIFDQAPTGLTPGSSSTPLGYTSAAADQLRAQVELMASADARQNPDGSAILASELSKGMFDLDRARHLATFTVLQTQSDGQRFKLQMTGVVDGQMRIIFGSPQDAPYYSATAECLDSSGKCQVAHVKITETDKGAPRIAHMIIREGNVDLFTSGNDAGIVGNPDYDRLLNILKNTATHRSNVNRVVKATLQTSETISGISNFSLGLDLFVNGAIQTQFIQMHGPLVQVGGSNHDTAFVERIPMASSSPEYVSETIQDTQLINNDGRGRLQFAITVGGPQGTQPDTLILTATRLPVSVRPATTL
jgi:hypothetical protein